jgi:hypothetical protein
MFKKLFVTAAAAAAVSVPLAGVAWAAPPSDPGSTDNPIGQGGLPQKLGSFVDTGITDGDPLTPSLNQGGGPTPPGSAFVKGFAQVPGVNTPQVVGQFENGLWSQQQIVNSDGTLTSIPTTFGDTPPGLALKPLTPGCNKGREVVPGDTNCVG